MRTWLKLLCTVVFIMGLAAPAFGGGIDNKQNFSAAYAGSLSRNGATDGADVAAYNPAGMMLLDNGFYLDINAQPFTFDYDHTYNGETYTASPTLVTPTAFGIYKTDKWAWFGGFTINGGGGETEYENGNIITEQIGNALIGGGSPPIPGGGTFSNEYAYAESYDYTLTTGASYKINEIFSVSAGIRYVWTDKEVDIRGNYSFVGEIIGKYDQEADGFGGVFGINIHPSDTINIGIRYETKVELDWKTTVDNATTAVGEAILAANGRVDGESYARDLPALLGIGFEWRVLPQLSINPSFTYYFEKDADWDTQNDVVDENSFDLAIGLQYDFNEQWSATAGYMHIDIGVKPEDYGLIEKMSPPLDCHAVALGAKYRMNENWLFTFGLTGYFYEEDTAPATATTPEVTYDKVLYSGAFGVQYKF